MKKKIILTLLFIICLFILLTVIKFLKEFKTEEQVEAIQRESEIFLESYMTSIATYFIEPSNGDYKLIDIDKNTLYDVSWKLNEKTKEKKYTVKRRKIKKSDINKLINAIENNETSTSMKWPQWHIDYKGKLVNLEVLPIDL